MKEKGGRQRRKAGPGKRYIIDVRWGIILILVLMAVCTGCSPDRHEETDTEDRESGGSEQEETAEDTGRFISRPQSRGCWIRLI